MQQIKKIEEKICKCSNKSKAIDRIVYDMKNKNNGFFLERAAIIIGKLILFTRTNSEFLKICELELSTLSTSFARYNITYKRFLIEALGKGADSKHEKILLNILKIPDLSKISMLIPAILTSLGKISNSENTIEILNKYISIKSEVSHLLSALWALGKIGSRELDEPVSIFVLEPFITKIINIATIHPHQQVIYNSIYSLAEICDKRRSGSASVSEEKSEMVLKFYETILARNQNSTNIKKLISITQKMVSGQILSTDDERYLLEIRDKVRVDL